MVDRLAAESLLTRYLAACQTLDLDIIVACFAPRAVVIDPTSPIVRGRAQVKRYFASIYDDLAALRLTTSPLYWRRDRLPLAGGGPAQGRQGDRVRRC
jgi:hypothetical protein